MLPPLTKVSDILFLSISCVMKDDILRKNR